MATDRRSAARRLVVLTVMLGAGCAGAGVPAAPADDPVLVDGQEIYASNCANCHGSSGEGGRGTRLNGGRVLDAFPDPADQMDVIANGRAAMPSFDFTPAEMEAIVGYTREVVANE